MEVINTIKALDTWMKDHGEHDESYDTVRELADKLDTLEMTW